MSYKEYNHNPKGIVTSDCVIRAIAFAEGKPWLEVFDSLVALAREEFSIPNDGTLYGKYLDKYPKIPVMHMVGKKRKRYTVKEICKWEGTYLVKIANHLTVVVDGAFYDIWDCGDKSSYVIWKVK